MLMVDESSKLGGPDAGGATNQTSMSIGTYAGNLTPGDARSLHREQLMRLISDVSDAELLEFGGGRDPLIKLEELPENVKSYTVNDIDQGELDLAPEGYKKACFDVCGDVSEFHGRYDLIISKMFAEHAEDGEAMHSNTLALLKKGGVAFHFMPKLYSMPLLINIIFPERWTQAVLYRIQPSRRNEKPKFPAHYSWCRGTTKSIEKRIKALGYSEVVIIPFYGYRYFDKFPVLNQLEKITRKVCVKYQLTFFSTNMFVFAKK